MKSVGELNPIPAPQYDAVMVIKEPIDNTQTEWLNDTQRVVW